MGQISRVAINDRLSNAAGLLLASALGMWHIAPFKFQCGSPLIKLAAFVLARWNSFAPDAQPFTLHGDMASN